MPIQLGSAAAAGLVGGVLMLGLRSLLTALGVDLRMDLLLMWGTLFRVRGALRQVVGLAMHAAVSLVIGVIYAVGFQLFGARDGLLLWGLLGGTIHWLFAGLFLAIVPSMHPEVPEQHPAPGPFARNLGGGEVSAFLAGHLVYGLSFGVAYAILNPGGAASAL